MLDKLDIEIAPFHWLSCPETLYQEYLQSAKSSLVDQCLIEVKNQSCHRQNDIQSSNKFLYTKLVMTPCVPPKGHTYCTRAIDRYMYVPIWIYKAITNSCQVTAKNTLEDTIHSWKQHLASEKFCHNAAHRPNIHCRTREQKFTKKPLSQDKETQYTITYMFCSKQKPVHDY